MSQQDGDKMTYKALTNQTASICGLHCFPIYLGWNNDCISLAHGPCKELTWRTSVFTYIVFMLLVHVHAFRHTDTSVLLSTDSVHDTIFNKICPLKPLYLSNSALVIYLVTKYMHGYSSVIILQADLLKFWIALEVELFLFQSYVSKTMQKTFFTHLNSKHMAACVIFMLQVLIGRCREQEDVSTSEIEDNISDETLPPYSTTDVAGAPQVSMSTAITLVNR